METTSERRWNPKALAEIVKESGPRTVLTSRDRSRLIAEINTAMESLRNEAAKQGPFISLLGFYRLSIQFGIEWLIASGNIESAEELRTRYDSIVKKYNLEN